MLMAADLRRALDPASLAHEAAIELDAWQAAFVRSTAPQIITLVPRQHGKTEAAVIKALSVAMTEPESLILIASPSQRQSDEFVLRARKAHNRIKDAPALIGDAARRITFENGSRILALPGDNDGDTLRGLANCRLAILDECSRVSDALANSIRPMLATNRRGQLVYLSTPHVKSGVFYETWISDDPEWHRIRVELGSCNRITPEFLARERKNLGETAFRTDYLLQFLENLEMAFSSEVIAGIIDPQLRALWT